MLDSPPSKADTICLRKPCKSGSVRYILLCRVCNRMHARSRSALLAATTTILFILLLLQVLFAAAQEPRCSTDSPTTRRAERFHRGAIATALRSPRDGSPHQQQQQQGALLLAYSRRNRTWSRLGFCGSSIHTSLRKRGRQQQQYRQQSFAPRVRYRGTTATRHVRSRVRWTTRHCLPLSGRPDTTTTTVADVGSRFLFSSSMAASPSQRSALRPHGDAARDAAQIGYGSSATTTSTVSTRAQRDPNLDIRGEDHAGKIV